MTETRWVFPRELDHRSVLVERPERGKPKFLQVSSVKNNACSSPNTTHVAVKGGGVQCYDNTRRVEIVA